MKFTKQKAQACIKEYFERAEVNRVTAAVLVKKARNLAMKHRIKMPPEFKRRYCAHCYSYLRPGVNCRIRLRAGKVVYYCLECKKFMRFPHLPSRKRR